MKPKPHSVQDVRDLLDEELGCVDAISVAIGESCGECIPCQARAVLRSLEEQLEAVTKQRDAIMSMLEAERPPEEVFAYARSLSNPATRPSERDPQLAHDYRMGMTPDE